MPQISVIPNGIDDFWHQNRSPKKVKNNELNDKWRIITVGKICQRKNQVTVADAIEEMKKEGMNIEYEIIGKKEDTKLVDIIKEKSFVEIKDFMPKEQLINEYRNNDLFVLASTNETFGLVYAEAMTQGLPVIYTRGQGFDEQFEEGTVGYAVACDSVDEIKTGIISVMKNYDSLSKSCFELSKRFNWNDVAENLKEEYRKCISKG